MKVGGPLHSTPHAAERQAVIQEYMNRDPHFRYTIVSRESDGPETVPAPQTVISVALMMGDHEVRFDASERYPGAIEDLGGHPRLAFSDDEDGKRARQTVDRLAREGGSARSAAAWAQ